MEKMSEYEDVEGRLAEDEKIYGEQFTEECNDHPMYQTLQRKFEAVKEENAELRERAENLEKITFQPATEVPNPPDLFQVAKECDMIGEHFYHKQSILEAMKVLRQYLNQPDMRIDIAWRVVTEK